LEACDDDITMPMERRDRVLTLRQSEPSHRAKLNDIKTIINLQTDVLDSFP